MTWQWVDEREEGVARRWRLDTGTEIEPVLAPIYDVDGAEFSVDGSYILTWSRGGAAQLWNASTGDPVGPVLAHGALMDGAAVSSDNSKILTWGDRVLLQWDATTGEVVGQPMTHQHPVESATFFQNQTLIMSTSKGDADSGLLDVNFWTATTGLPTFENFEQVQVLSAAKSQDESRILTVGLDGAARVWSLDTAAETVPLYNSDALLPPIRPLVDGNGKVLFGAILSNDRTRVLSWLDDQVTLWDARTGQRVFTFKADSVSKALFSPDDALILTLSTIEEKAWVTDPDRPRGQINRPITTVKLWTTETGEQLGPAMTHDVGVDDAFFSLDGKEVITWSVDGTLRKWSPQAGPTRSSLDTSGEKFDALCDVTFKGSLAKSNTGEMVPYIRLIDQEMVAAAPMLVSRLGEDVCAKNPLPSWLDTTIPRIMQWTGME